MSRALMVSAALSLGLLTVMASPGHSSTLTGPNWVSTPDGLVGVEQTVIIKATRSAGQVATVTFDNDDAGTNAGQAFVNPQGFAYLPWTPNLPGTWKISALVGGETVDTAAITVAGMPTSTVLLVPGSVARNQQTSLLAEVSALGGSITPSGTISVRDQTNSIVGTGALRPTGISGLASAEISWTPVSGPIQLTAFYIPATSAFVTSTSLTQTPIVGGSQAVSLRLPPTSYVGVPETIAAVIQPSFQSSLGGSVGFSLSIDGFEFYPMGGSQPAGTGIGTTRWTPTQAGIQTIKVAYASADFAVNGTDAQAINVLPAPTLDSITVTPTGSTAWTSGNVGTMDQGTSLQLVPTSASGHTVTLSTDGPCALRADKLTLLGPGLCTVAAESLGDGGSLAPTDASYTITVRPNTP